MPNCKTVERVIQRNQMMAEAAQLIAKKIGCVTLYDGGLLGEKHFCSKDPFNPDNSHRLVSDYLEFISFYYDDADLLPLALPDGFILLNIFGGDPSICHMYKRGLSRDEVLTQMEQSAKRFYTFALELTDTEQK